MTTQFTLDNNGVKLNVITDGEPSNPALLLHHSLGGSLAQWRELAPVLAKDFYVIRYDCRGHGASDAPAGEYTLSILSDDALYVLDTLNVDRAAFIGLSLGGMVAMQLGIEAPNRIQSLVLANTTTFIPNKQMWDDNITKARAKGMGPITRPTLERWFCASFRAAQPAEFERHVEVMAGMPVNGYAGCCAVLRDVDLREGIKNITAPTLVVAGEEDMPQAVDGAKAMTAKISGAEFALIEKAAHLSPIEKGPAFFSAVKDFFRRRMA